MLGLKDGFPCGKNRKTSKTFVFQCGGEKSWDMPECSLELNMSQGQRDKEFSANSDVIMYFSTKIQHIFKLSFGHPKYVCTTE